MATEQSRAINPKRMHSVVAKTIKKYIYRKQPAKEMVFFSDKKSTSIFGVMVDE